MAFGLPPVGAGGILLERFRGAKAIAAPKVSEIMRKQTSQQVMAGLWNKRFPGLIPGPQGNLHRFVWTMKVPRPPPPAPQLLSD
jgi:hypothetical protein